MNKLIANIAAMLVLGFGAGCPHLEIARMYNDSGADRTLLVGSGSYYWSSATMWSGNYLEGARRLEVHRGETVWRYDWQRVPEEFGTEFWNKTTFNLQLEPSGLIYLVKPQQKMPVSQFDAQPPCWPLRPAEIVPSQAE